MERKVIVVYSPFGEFEVDSQRLAESLREAARDARSRGVRPGTPVERTPNNTISHEKLATYDTILREEMRRYRRIHGIEGS